jgi:uncharacterized protein
MTAKRIAGIDVARALAVIGMIIVNFKTVFGSEGSPLLKTFAGVFDGKAAATFVVLAGIGLAFMTNSAVRDADNAKLKLARWRIGKRALFLFVVGLSYLWIWPADILHFYGVYMLLTLAFLSVSNKQVIAAVIVIILSYPLLLLVVDYDTGWNFDTLEYLDFWSIFGFLRNLFYNGFHPVIPWAAFMLFGLWFGRQDLRDDAFVRKALFTGLAAFILVQLLSYGLLWFLSEGDALAYAELEQVLGTSPMPPLPFYMVNGIAAAVVIISSCILLVRRNPTSFLIDALTKTGQLALTFYVAHVIIGMGMVDSLLGKPLGTYTIDFSLGYALLFSLACVAFALVWRKFFASGPLEWVMRKVTG